VNNAIRAREVRVVAPDGSQVGVKKLEEALWLADQLGLDLVEVAPEARPPVCRMMDYGKYKYEQSVKQREARKKQTRTVIKEVRLRPRIGDHDFDIVRRRAEQFLSEGDKVKVTVRFRGRENERPELGHRLVERLMEDLEELAIVEQTARKDGRTMTMVMAPTRKALDIAAAAKEESDERRAAASGRRHEAPAVAEAEESPEVVDEETVPADDAEIPAVAETAEVLEVVDDETAPADDAELPGDVEPTVEIESAEATDAAEDDTEEGEGN
jgi:translation initiation factor IF-3